MTNTTTFTRLDRAVLEALDDIRSAYGPTPYDTHFTAYDATHAKIEYTTEEYAVRADIDLDAGEVTRSHCLLEPGYQWSEDYRYAV